MQNVSLFDRIQPKELNQLLSCCEAKTRTFEKGEFIWLAGNPAQHIGIVKTGQVNIIREDMAGNRHIIGRVTPGQIFGEAFACASLTTYPVSVQATQPGQIMLLSLGKVLNQCPKNCAFHAQLIQNLMHIIAEKNILLNQKIFLLSYKTTRQKIAALLLSQMKSSQDTQVTLPFSREEMADYFGLNRSALSRELSQMQSDGLIAYHKNIFSLTDLDRLGQLAHD